MADMTGHFRHGQRIVRHDGLNATFLRYIKPRGFIVVRYDEDSTPERVAYEQGFRAAGERGSDR